MKLDIISKSEAARYMGVRGEPDKIIAEILDKYEEIVRNQLKPAYVYRESSVVSCNDGIRINGINTLFMGNDIKNHLKGCDRVIIFAATVSAAADKLIRQISVTDTAAAFAVDCLCSAAIEQICDKAEQEIFTEIHAPYRTWRFSPGYGDLPISLQKDLLLFLNAQRRIGLTVTDSCMLIPSKSVTAIIGISNFPQKHSKKGCNICNMRESCAFRHNGGCGK
ncbi:MAG: 5-methyltetrahydrofolate--homocysteine methyltransferase [Ruminococcus sp.]|nr:5-methyltetrahydrofolate--homocysteine methyltransferase [Ruminococcus sp.]